MGTLSKAPRTEVDLKDPWANDPFERHVHGERLARLIWSLDNQSYSIALNGDWGSGKSVFLRRLAAHLELNRPATPVIHIDAWQSDYADDPLIPFIAAITDRLRQDAKNGKALSETIKSLGSKLAMPTASLLANLVAPAGGRVVNVVEAAAKLGEGLIDWETQRLRTSERFRQALESARDVLTKRLPGKPVQPVVIAIDELDRCRPDFSVRALERIKHFFNVPGVIFLIATDQGNLPAAVRSVYGESIDGERYLRKFFDYEYSLPSPHALQYIEVLWNEFGMDDILPADSPSHIESAYNDFGGWQAAWAKHKSALDRFEYMHCFSVFSNHLELALRDQAQAFTMLSAHLRAARPGTCLLPLIDTFCVLLRFADAEAFDALRRGRLHIQRYFEEAAPAMKSALSFQGKALRTFLGTATLLEMRQSYANAVRLSLNSGDYQSAMPMKRMLDRTAELDVDPQLYVESLLGLFDVFNGEM